VSGTRSTRGADGGGDPYGGGEWPDAFAGPAQYSPTRSEIDQHEIRQHGGYAEPYTPYADGPAGRPDPYAFEDPDAAYRAAADGYRGPGGHAAPAYPDPYADESFGDPYGGPHPGAGYAGYREEPYQRDDYGYQPERQAYSAPAPAATLLADGPDTFAGRAGTLEHSGGHAAPFEPQYEAERAPAPAAVPRQRDAGRGSTGRNRSRLTGTSTAGKLVRGVVLVALVGGAAAYVALEKTVTLSIDGQTRQVHSFAGTVGAVLVSDSITTGRHDYVSPAPSAPLVDDATITVRYGRPIDVTVNGTKQDVWVHSTTVGGALAELGVRITGAAMSVPAGTAIGRAGLTFSVFTQRHIQILVDGRTVPLATTAATVAQALTQAGVVLRDQDSASVPLTSLPTDGETVSVLRITGTTQVEQVPIPFPITKKSDATLYLGATDVITPGQDGEAKVTYAFQTINGVKQKPKEIARTVTKQPVAEVENVGTKALPSSASDLDWAALAKCESGGNPHAVDPSGTYYGLYQFSVSTWDSLGGSGLPSQASPAEQTERAELLYERSGAGQWPVCGHNLFS
jgi:resuscitation-promoting factor RpfB